MNADKIADRAKTISDMTGPHSQSEWFRPKRIDMVIMSAHATILEAAIRDQTKTLEKIATLLETLLTRTITGTI